MSSTSPLFQPFALKSLSLPNRIAMAPMTRSFSPEQTPGDDVAAYYRRRADGGVGLIITEGTTLEDDRSTGDHRVPKVAGNVPLEAWRKVCESVHQTEAKIACQIWHVGALRKAEKTPYPDVESVSPSGLMLPGKTRGKALSESDIADTVADYARCAANAKAVGFDAVEIHGAHGYLIDQFFWEGTNTRTDKYGGDMVARTRFAAEIIKAVRDATGPDYPVILRFSQWKQQDFEAKLAPTPQALEQFLAPLSEAGVDIFHCSTRRYWESEFEGSDLNLAGWTKKLSGKPTITVGSIGLDTDFIATYGASDTAQTRGIDELEQRMADGEFDLAAVGRALIANPDWPNLIRENKTGAIKPYEKTMLGELV